MAKIKNTKKEIIGVKELRLHLDKYITQVQKGESFIVVKRSKPVFRMMPLEEDSELWELVVDFTKFKKGGVKIEELLSRL